MSAAEEAKLAVANSSERQCSGLLERQLPSCLKTMLVPASLDASPELTINARTERYQRPFMDVYATHSASIAKSSPSLGAPWSCSQILVKPVLRMHHLLGPLGKIGLQWWHALRMYLLLGPLAKDGLQRANI